MEYLPRHTFIANPPLNEEQKEYWTKGIDSPDRLHFLRFRYNPPEYIRQHAWEWGLSIENWAEETFGFSLVDRGFAEKRIGVVSRKFLSYGRRKKDICTAPKNFNGAVFPQYSEIILAQDLPETEQLAVLRHELVHAYAHQSLYIGKNPDTTRYIRLYRGGYGINSGDGSQRMRFLDEAITEMIHMEVWKYAYHLGRVHEEYVDIGYQYNTLILEELIRRSAQRTDNDPERILHYLYKGYFDGTQAGLRMLDNGLARNTMRHISRLPGEITLVHDELATLYEDICSSRVVKKARKYFHGEETEIFSLKVKRSTPSGKPDADFPVV